MSLWHCLAFSANQKLERKIYSLGKGHEIISTLQLAMSNSKNNQMETKTRYESRRMVLNQESGPR